MSKPSAFNEKERADLVAYLDGELEGEPARALEQKLALDPDARAEADGLKRTWDLLDFLPKSEPSPDFTHRTMDRLAPIKTGEQRAASGSATVGPHCLPAVGRRALVLAVLGGYFGFNQFVPREPGRRRTGARPERHQERTSLRTGRRHRLRPRTRSTRPVRRRQSRFVSPVFTFRVPGAFVMRHPVRLVVVLVLPIAAGCASSEQGADDTDRNARLVEKYRRDDPAYYERLRRDLRAFHRLPADRQDRLRKLDHDLHEQDSATQRSTCGMCWTASTPGSTASPRKIAGASRKPRTATNGSASSRSCANRSSSADCRRRCKRNWTSSRRRSVPRRSPGGAKKNGEYG